MSFMDDTMSRMVRWLCSSSSVSLRYMFSLTRPTSSLYMRTQSEKGISIISRYERKNRTNTFTPWRIKLTSTIYTC